MTLYAHNLEKPLIFMDEYGNYAKCKKMRKIYVQNSTHIY